MVPCFVVGSGRCGTKSIARLLGQVPGVEAEHEYHCVEVQKLGCLYQAGRLRFVETVDRLREIYGSAVHYAPPGTTYFISVSNKDSWLLPPLVSLFPDARFVLLVRDGRKVASSFQKLRGEALTDRGVQALTRYLEDETRQTLPPPPTKEWWWVTGYLEGDNLAEMDQFSRFVWHWREVNRYALFTLENCISPDRWAWFRLEDLTRDPVYLKRLFWFLGLDYREEYFKSLRRPHNVTVPEDYPLTPEQTERFWGFPGVREMMEKFGYNGPEYRVEYHPDGEEELEMEGNGYGYCGA